MIVVDVGCQPHGSEESVYHLVERFRPTVLFGFDPHPDLAEGVEWFWHPSGDKGPSANTAIVRRRAAAWTEACQLPYREEAHDGVPGIASGIAFDSLSPEFVPAIDLPGFVDALPGNDGIVLKLDCEGAEYPILRNLVDRGVDRRLALVLVEWHPEETAHGMYVRPAFRPSLRCPVGEW